MDREEASAIVRQRGWLSMTHAEFQDAALAQCELLQFAAGASIYNAGDDTGGLYGVVDGSVGLHLLSPDGELGLGHIGKAGFWTGDLSAVTGRPRRIAISAETSCRLLRLPRTGLMTIVGAQPSAWQHVANLLASNLQLTLDIIDALKRDDPIMRMAATLLNLISGETVGPFTINVSQSGLGAVANMSRGTVNMVTAKLRARGWLEIGYGKLIVTDREALEQFLYGG
jgi:CRP/FNR family transcriptional regulator, cyclic AMP receptor protein